MPRHRSQGTTRERHGPVIASIIWTALPIVTFGMATVFVMLFAAIRKRSMLLGLSMLVYVPAAIVLFASDNDGVAMVVLWLVGSTHALAIRRWVFDLDRQPRPNSLKKQDAALLSHAEQTRVRERAREIVRDDPALAQQLKIGRPDLDAREFPDGGLVDVNNVPATALMEELGLSAELAERLGQARQSQNGFVSVADLTISLDLPPNAFDGLADRLIILPMATPLDKH